MSTHIVCPSGLAGEIRKLRGTEAKILTDRNAARAGSTFEQLLVGCWLQTTDAGLYTLRENGALDWSQVLVADRFYTLFRLRELTFGDDYSFEAQCASTVCRKPFEWTLQLSELPVRPLPEASKATFKAGNRFETQIAGRRVWFKLHTGADEVRAAKALHSSRDGLLYTALLGRIIEVEGVVASGVRAFLDDTDMDELAALLDRFDDVDGGVDTQIEVECPHCLAVQSIQLPFAKGFFLPKGKPATTTATAHRA